MLKFTLLQFLLIILSDIALGYALGYLVGMYTRRLPVRQFSHNFVRYIDIVREGIAYIDSRHDMTNDEKREYVHSWAKSEIHGKNGIWVPDSTINFLIETAILQQKH